MNFKTISISIAPTLLTLASTIAAPMPAQAQSVTPMQSSFNQAFVSIANQLAEDPKYFSARTSVMMFNEDSKLRGVWFKLGKNICTLKGLGQTDDQVVSVLNRGLVKQGLDPEALDVHQINAAVTMIAAKMTICPWLD